MGSYRMDERDLDDILETLHEMRENLQRSIQAKTLQEKKEWLVFVDFDVNYLKEKYEINFDKIKGDRNG